MFPMFRFKKKKMINVRKYFVAWHSNFEKRGNFFKAEVVKWGGIQYKI